MGKSAAENLLRDLEVHAGDDVPETGTPQDRVDANVHSFAAIMAAGSNPLIIDTPEQDFLRCLGRELAACAADNEMMHLTMLLKFCESPIERILISTVWMRATQLQLLGQARPVILHSTGNAIGDPFGRETLTIEPQAKIGKFRVDFRLTRILMVPDFGSLDPKGVPGAKLIRRELLVECDGHEFHDATKERAAKDKARDRELQSAGYNLFRFTGSEIWNKPLTCAKQILDHLEKWSDE